MNCCSTPELSDVDMLMDRNESDKHDQSNDKLKAKHKKSKSKKSHKHKKKEEKHPKYVYSTNCIIND